MARSGRSERSARAGFREHLRSDWEEWLRDFPELATWVGHPGYNDRWTDDSPEGVEARRAHLRQSAGKLAALDRRALPARERLSYDLYQGLLDSATAGLAYGDDALPYRFTVPRNLWMPLTQMEGIHILAADTLELQPRATREDYAAVLSRLRALPAAVEQNLALLEAGRTKGHTPPRRAIRGAPGQVDRLLPEKPLESALLVPFVEWPPTLPEAERQALRAEAEGIYLDLLVPAFRSLREYLTGRYLPACRETVGTFALPDGERNYAFRVRWQTTLELTPHEIHAIGRREVERLGKEMESLARQSGFPGGVADFRKFLRSDPRFFYSRPEELVDGYRVIGKRCDPGLARLFGKLPRLPYGVAPMPEYRAANSPSAYYGPGAPRAGRAGFFYVNTHDLPSRAKWEMEALALHESVPGHHLQISIAQELEDLPEFRRFSGYTAFVEGWGLYAESLGTELGFYRDAYAQFGALSFDMWRSVRLVVDTGIHAMGWSREAAVEYFRAHTGSSEQDIGVEVDRYIVWPGQALAYKIGQLEIAELRRYAEQRLGSRFDERAFHDVVLGEGALPLQELGRRVRAWVRRSAASAPSPAPPPASG